MTKLIFFSFAFYLASCNEPNPRDRAGSIASGNQAASNDYIWTKLLDSAGWKKSYNFQMLSIRDTLWTLHFDGNWYSTDGTKWTKAKLPNAIGNLAFLKYVLFKEVLYSVGHFEGNIESYSLKNEIYRTTNFLQWDTLSKSSNLPKRFFHQPFAFQDKLWIIGGEDQNTQYADMWNSADGITWIKQKDNLPFGKRSRSQIVQLNNKLFLLNNDVWSSTDGLTWQKEADEILKGETVFGYAALVFEGQIWLLGCNRNGLFSSQVLVSKNGKTWKPQDAPWTPRGGIAATVYKGKIYMTGGKYGGLPNQPDFVYSNDVWSCENSE